MSIDTGTKPRLVLPYPPRGLRRPEAAAYIGVSPSTLDAMIRDGFMPKPKRYGNRTIWDRVAIDEAFACLPDEENAKPASTNPWDALQ